MDPTKTTNSIILHVFDWCKYRGNSEKCWVDWSCYPFWSHASFSSYLYKSLCSCFLFPCTYSIASCYVFFLIYASYSLFKKKRINGSSTNEFQIKWHGWINMALNSKIFMHQLVKAFPKKWFRKGQAQSMEVPIFMWMVSCFFVIGHWSNTRFILDS